MQAHDPIRKQTKVVGHALRAMYLFAATAELACEDNDAELLATCERLWEDVVTSKLYITGGIGSASENEGFTRDYDLPNENSYAETCASIGLFLFGHRLLRSRLDAQYGDVMEQALYNNILSGIGVDGRCFFTTIPWPATERIGESIGHGGLHAARPISPDSSVHCRDTSIRRELRRWPSTTMSTARRWSTAFSCRSGAGSPSLETTP
jgi:DUF1680 family protein